MGGWVQTLLGIVVKRKKKVKQNLKCAGYMYAYVFLALNLNKEIVVVESKFIMSSSFAFKELCCRCILFFINSEANLK